jgi:hypothetical protein
MSKLLGLVGASFSLLGLLVGWVLGYQAAKQERGASTDEFTDGGGV